MKLVTYCALVTFLKFESSLLKARRVEEIVRSKREFKMIGVSFCELRK